MGKLITPSGAEIVVLPKIGKHFSLEELQSLVGGLIEILYTEDGQPIVVNEEGRLKKLERNDKATTMWRSESKRSRYDFIVGDALFCEKGEKQGHGELE